jgi:hypothetical protein
MAMNYYFKLPKNLPPPHYLIHVGEVNDLNMPMRVLMMAEKAWAESNDGTVRVIKDRQDQNHFDHKEFFWVKLSSIPVS